MTWNCRLVREGDMESVGIRASNEEWRDMFEAMIDSIRTHDGPPDRPMARSVLSQLAVALECPIPDDIKAWLGQA